MSLGRTARLAVIRESGLRRRRERRGLGRRSMRVSPGPSLTRSRRPPLPRSKDNEEATSRRDSEQTTFCSIAKPDSRHVGEVRDEVPLKLAEEAMHDSVGAEEVSPPCGRPVLVLLLVLYPREYLEFLRQERVESSQLASGRGRLRGGVQDDGVELSEDLAWQRRELPCKTRHRVGLPGRTCHEGVIAGSVGL